MTGKNNNFAIINRGFWPEYPIVGEALLNLAEKMGTYTKVIVITQSKRKDLSDLIKKRTNNTDIDVFSCKSLSTSGASAFKRILDTMLFFIWVLVILLIKRPRGIYISTNPPFLIPFVVMLYSKIFRRKYFYHLQDIHPEATDIIYPLPKLLFIVLRYLDNIVIRNASGIITISDEMRDVIIERSNTKAPIIIIENPTTMPPLEKGTEKTKDIVFCGAIGRYQKIPLLIDAITKYINEGGRLKFTFIGKGAFQEQVRKLSDDFDTVDYLGYLHPDKSQAELRMHKWALLPIDDKVTQFAFPSKSSSYIVSGCSILAVCSSHTSVAKWVRENNIGISAENNIDSITNILWSIEKDEYSFPSFNEPLVIRLSVPYFVKKIHYFISELN